MRLWSIHPRFLDPAGLNACWREGLLAKYVLEGKTKGYTNHPQLLRFKKTDNALFYINAYLTSVYKEAIRRGYSYGADKIQMTESYPTLSVTVGQIAYEKEHLLEKLKKRNPDFLINLQDVSDKDLLHPLFHMIDGEIEEWEIIK